MSVLVKNQDGKIINFIKGADESIAGKLGLKEEFEENTILNVNLMANHGLRTLMFAFKKFD